MGVITVSDAALNGLFVVRLAERLVWVAPVGNEVSIDDKYDLRGFMVCKRVINNTDQKNTRIDYLRVTPGNNGKWKTPFQEDKCLFPSLGEALEAAMYAEGFLC